MKECKFINGLELEKKLGKGETHYPENLISDAESKNFPKYIYKFAALFLSEIKDNNIGVYCRPYTTGNFITYVNLQNLKNIKVITEEEFIKDNGFDVNKVYDEEYYKKLITWFY